MTKNPCGYDDCFSCPYEDCICPDDAEPEWRRYPEARRRAEVKRGKKRIAQRKTWLAQGRCTHCGAALPEGSRYRQCEACRRKGREYAERRRRAQGKGSPGIYEYMGLCKRCGKAPPKEGYKICGRCYANSLDGLRKARMISGGRKQNNGFTQDVDAFWAGYKKPGARPKIR